MGNRRTTILTVIAAALVSLFLPALASAQGNYDPWWGNRGRNRDIRDRDHRHDDDYNDRDHRSGRISDSDRRLLRQTARRIEDRSNDFQRNLDRLLDRSRYDGTRGEDHINQDVRNFREAAGRFEDRAGNDRDLNRSAGEARQLIETATHVESYLRRVRLDSRTASDWTQIRQDLRTIADIYGFRLRDFGDDGYYRSGNDDYRRGRNNDRRRLPRNFPF